MNCVNKSSKEFKDLVLRHNVDSNALELIVHKYWKETEQEDTFPSDVYIQAQLGFSQYKEPSKIIRTLWKTQYSHPKEFLTFQQLQIALEQAHKVFPSETIVYYKNSKGNYVLNIKEPVSSFKEFPLQKKAMSDKEASFHLNYWEWRRIKKEALIKRLRETKEPIYKTIKQFNIENGTNFQFYYGEVQSRHSKYLIDRISSTGSASDRSQIQAISSFLQQLFPGIQVKVMDKENFGSVISQQGFPVNTQAFLMGNTIYTSTEMKSADVLIEEFLHPFIEILYNDNKELFNNLWKEAQREFSMLADQIRESYSPVAYQNLSEEVRAKELVTQALSRYMRESMGKDGTRHNKFKDFVQQFIAFVKDMFGLDQTPEFRKSATGTRMIPISSLTNINSLANLASALNTEGISFDVRKGLKEGNQVTFHLENPPVDEEKYETKKLPDGRIVLLNKQLPLTPITTDNKTQTPVTRETWNLYKKLVSEEMNGFEPVKFLPEVVHQLPLETIQDLLFTSGKNTTKEALEQRLISEGSFWGPTVSNLIIEGKKETVDVITDLYEQDIDIAATENQWNKERIVGVCDPSKKKQTPTIDAPKKDTMEQPAQTIEYTPQGKEKQTYTVRGNQIYNKDGKEVFVGESVDRNKILANLAIKNKKALVVEHKNNKYVVHDDGRIVSVTTGKIMQWGEENGDRRAILEQYKLKKEEQKKKQETYEVSSRGDKRFSALYATFKPGTTILGEDVGGKTIEYVYQNIIKKSRKGQAPASDSILSNWRGYFEGGGVIIEDHYPDLPASLVSKMEDSVMGDYKLTKEDLEDISYYMGYLPLWEEWAKQNPQLIEELRLKSEGKVLTDRFANTRVSQARALTDILSTPSIVEQLVSHMQNNGIAAYNKEEFDAFLKKYGYDNIQEAVPFSKDYPYKNKLKSSEEERDDIINEVIHRKYKLNGTDIIKIGNTLFLIDVMPSTDLFTYYPSGKIPDAEGYGIRSRFNINKTTKADVREIIRNIALLYGFDYGSINKMLLNLGIESRYLSKPLITSAIKEAKRDVAKRNSRKFGVPGKSQGNRKSENSDSNNSGTNKGSLSRLEETKFFIGKKIRISYKEVLHKYRPDLTELQIDAQLNFLHSLEDTKENTAYIKAAIRWIANKSIALPRDNEIAEQVFKFARNHNIDLFKYRTLYDVVTSQEFKKEFEKSKPKFDPDKARTFHNKETRITKNGRTFTVYDVDNTEEGQREVCKALYSSYNVSPWCLSTFTASGEPTESAKKYWKKYNAIPRKIAFEDGRPVAFSSHETPLKGTLLGVRVEEAPEELSLLFPLIVDDTDPNFNQEEWLYNALDLGYLDFAGDKIGLTEEGVKNVVADSNNEAWWDLEDKSPKESLSDEIEGKKVGVRGNQDNHGPSNLIEQVQIAEQDVLNDIQEAEIEAEEEENIYHSLLHEAEELGFDSDRYREQLGYPPDTGNPWNTLQERERLQILRNYINANTDVEELPFLKDNEQIYGFVAGGKIYLNTDKISPNVPLHEYTHLWDTAIIQLEKKYPQTYKLWSRGKVLMREGATSLWKEIVEDENYGKKWRQKVNDGRLNEEDFENLVASEVHARLVGPRGEELLKQLEEKKGKKNIVAKLRQWLLDFYRTLKATFTPWTVDELNNLTLDDFVHMTLRDFVNGVNPNVMRALPETTGVKGDTKIAKEKVSPAYTQTVNAINNYFVEQRKHINFDRDSHTYYINGKKVDYSVTQLYKNENIPGDYKYAVAIGNTIDSITRDFFNPNISPEEFARKQYPNFNESRKAEVVEDLKKLKSHFDKTYGEGNYSVSTIKFPLVGTVQQWSGRVSIAGTMDMLVTDADGNVHIYDMKAKKYDITDRFSGMEGYVFQQNAYRQLLETAIPALKGKVKDMHLLWFKQSYPSQGKNGVTYTTDVLNNVTVEDKNNNFHDLSLTQYSEWQTPRFYSKIEDSLVEIPVKDVLDNPQQIDLQKFGTENTQQEEQKSEKSDNNTNASNVNTNNNILNISQDEYTDEFRRVYKGSTGMGQEAISQFHRGTRQLTEDEQRRLETILRGLLSKGGSTGHGKWIDINGKGNPFKVTQVNAQLFYDVFKTCRNYLRNGELVDLHEVRDTEEHGIGYEKCINYLTDDGMCGFSITPDGNLISVFSLNPAGIKEKKKFLYAIKDLVRELGATHLDAYMSPNQPLMEIYEKTLGFKPASIMDYNMEHDHDDIAKNHDKPKVVFMVASDSPVEVKHFSKDEYDAAKTYQKQILNSSTHGNNLNKTSMKMQNQPNKIEIYKGNWSREEVEKQQDKVFLFGDNTEDRTVTHHIPIATQAVIRGLPNAIGIDTKKNRRTSKDSYFTDSDFDLFKTQVDSAIQKALNSGKIIVIPEGGIGTGKAQLQQRAPKLFKYLQDKLENLKSKQVTNTVKTKETVAPKRKKQTAKPTTFTFNDGVTVKAPFEPNEQQVTALNTLSDFLKSNDHTITLSGYAGTGKTSLMEIFAQKVRKDKKKIIFSASTNKAAAVLKEKVARQNFTATTLNKVFGINVEVSSSSSYDARNLQTVLKDAKVSEGNIVVIDEASMINEENYGIINQIAQEYDLKIIYVGDSAQLAPVGETLISKVFRNQDGKVIELTQVERTGDNAILEEATAIREGKSFSKISSFNEEGQGVAYISKSNNDSINEIFQQFVPKLRKNPNAFRVLAFTNKKVEEYNNYIRKILGYTSPVPSVNEPLMGYSNWSYNKKTKTYEVINSESYVVSKVLPSKVVTLRTGNHLYSLLSTPLILNDSIGQSIYVNYIDIKENESNKEIVKQLAQRKKELWEECRKNPLKRGEVLEEINNIEKFLFVNDNVIDDKGHYLQTKTADFGYAMTVHKSQGSTFDNVLIDDIDIAKASQESTMANAVEVSLEEDDIPDMASAEMVGEGEEITIDLDGESIEPVTVANIQSNNTLNMKQQLEYVAVSRASETATIITTGVKKEGSPLHPENSLVETQQTTSEMTENFENPEWGNFDNFEEEENEQETTNPINISLSQYEMWTGEENLTVDAEWKVSLLKNLDKQLSYSNTEEENQEILDNMDAIFKAKSIEEIEGTAPKSESETTENELSTYDKILIQLDNLLDNDGLMTSSEIRDVSQQIIDYISDLITKYRNNPSIVKKQFPNLHTSLDFAKASRKEIVEVIGIDNLISVARAFWSNWNSDYEDFETMDQADLLTENWDALMMMASNLFVANEGFGIIKNLDSNTWEVTDASYIDCDNYNESNDPDSIAETEGNLQEHWQIESRTIDVLNSMSSIVRMGLHECYILDKNGQKQYTKWEVPKRVPAREAVNKILLWTKGAVSLQDMVEKLKVQQERNPWLSQLIDALTNTDGSMTDFQSQFYGVFCKDFQSYSIILLENGKYRSMNVNSSPALAEALTSITSRFKAGIHPLITSKGINASLLGKKGDTGSSISLHKILDTLQASDNGDSISERAYRRIPLTEEMWDTTIKNLTAASKILGYPVPEELMKEALTQENLNTVIYYLKVTIDDLDKAQAELQHHPDFDYQPFTYKAKHNIWNSVKNFITPVTQLLEETATTAFYDSGKLYQSYVTPSFLTMLMNKFNMDEERFQDFLMDNYGNSEWFYKNDHWRSSWLREMADNRDKRAAFEHKVELNFNKHNYMRGMTKYELILSAIAEYFSCKDDDYGSLAWFRIPIMSNKPSAEYIKFYTHKGMFYKDSVINDLYDVFLQEVSRIQTVNRRNLSKDDEGYITNWDENGKKFCFLQELNPYLVENGKPNLILDEEGKVSKENQELASLLQKFVEGEEDLTSEEHTRLSVLTKKAIRAFMESHFSDVLDGYEKTGILEEAKKIEGITDPKFKNDDKAIREGVENFLWNDRVAAINILQLTVGDTAFYKNAEDLHKRLAQLHAPGIRANLSATDYDGNLVSDGKYRTVLINDFEKYKSNIIANITEVLDRKIAQTSGEARRGWEVLKDSLVGLKGKFTEINVTDGQGFSSPTSYRKKAFMFGKWSRQAEKVYQNLLSNNYTLADLETVFSAQKPFVYAQVHKNLGVEDAPIHTMNVAFQAKNSEYLLIMAGALLEGESLSRPNLLKALYDVMEESEKKNPRAGIDTIQFVSAIKSGLQGGIDILQFKDSPNGEADAKAYIEDKIYKRDNNGNLTNEYNTDVYVHEMSYDCYCIQQEVPNHFMNHVQAHGSQIRMTVPTDLEEHIDPNGDLSDPNNIVYYEFDEPDGTHKKLTAQEFQKEYEETIAASIDESFEELVNELHLSGSKKERNLALSKILIREVLGDPRYGTDLIQACMVDKTTGEFRIPLGDPIQAKRIEQLINSIIKNRINKQEIAGGPVVQVSNFGASKQLNIRFFDKNGSLLKTEEDWNKEHGVTENKNTEPTKPVGDAISKFNEKYGKLTTQKTYKDYINENQAGVAYYEVFMPAWSNKIFEYFADEKGLIDVKAIEDLCPDLLEFIGYRIPTEAKYSCAKLKCVGFLPKEAGDCMMLPYELTAINDSDFDIDKEYILRKEIYINKKSDKQITAAIKRILTLDSSKLNEEEKKVKEHFQKFLADKQITAANQDIDKAIKSLQEESSLTQQEKSEIYNQYKEQVKGLNLDSDAFTQGWQTAFKDAYKKKAKPTIEDIKQFVADPNKFKGTNTWYEALWEVYKRVAYTVDYPKKGKAYRDNKVIAMTSAVFTHNKIADQMLNPGGFDDLKKLAYLCAAYKKTMGNTSFGNLELASTSKLKDLYYTDKDLTCFDTHTQFYEQDAAAASLIGIAAVAKIAHCTLEKDKLYVAIDELCGEEGFTIDGFTFKGHMLLDDLYNEDGELISKILGSHVSASADAVKDPVFNLVNINPITINVLDAMIRLRISKKKAHLFLASDVITRVVDTFNRENLNGYTSLNSVVESFISSISNTYHIDEDSSINSEPITKEELIEGLLQTDHPEIDYKILKAFQKLYNVANAIRKPSFVTRFNSVSSAVGPLIVDNLILEHKIEDFMPMTNSEGKQISTGFYDANGNIITIYDILENHPILNSFAKAVSLAQQLFREMPAGSTEFRTLLKYLPEDISTKIFRDRELLSKLSDFFQSYLLIASDFIDQEHFKNYVNNFPQWFMRQDFQSKYPDNPLIQAIKLDTNKKTGRPYLKVGITGKDQQEKDILGYGWIDLFKKDKELATYLFEYNFFRGGLGFNPKTFMSLLPVYVKQKLKSTTEDGTEISYNDVFKKLPEIPYEIVIDQFIRNNWDNSKLVPTKGNKKSRFMYDWGKKKLVITNPDDLIAVGDATYIKTRYNNITYMWKIQSSSKEEKIFEMVSPLGNNKEYLEISKNPIKQSMEETIQVVVEKEDSPLVSANTDTQEAPVSNLDTEKKTAKKLEEFANAMMTLDPSKTLDDAYNLIDNIKKANVPKIFGGYLQNVFKQMNLELSKEEALKEFEKYC